MKWTFTQIEGNPTEAPRKTLELDGWNAPFGRPRQDPVIREVIKSRIQTTRYPGSHKQTRHAFGTNWESTELKGRWMSKAGGKLASEMADEWTAFVQDERTCRIAWGFIVSYIGYIEELEIARESEHEIAWRMRIQIDNRDDQNKRSAPPNLKPAADDLSDITNWMAFSRKLLEPAIPDMSGDFLDQLDQLAAALNVPAAEMNKLAGRFDDLEKASFSTLQHFKGAVTGFRNALNQFRDTAVNAGIDSTMLVRSAESDIRWLRYQLDLDDQVYMIKDQLNRLARQAELAQKIEVSKFVLAREGDTWESISIRATGSAAKAGAIRQLNGARYGEHPEVGESYLVQ